MLDVSTSMLANQASNFLATGEVPKRLGNQHPNIVPYQVMPAADGYFTLAVGNDPTFERFISVAKEAVVEKGMEKAATVGQTCFDVGIVWNCLELFGIVS